jgi:Cu(I)/Ag(I) efflux system membrane fusion protein
MNTGNRHLVFLVAALLFARVAICADAPHQKHAAATGTAAEAEAEAETKAITVDDRAALTISRTEQAAVGMQTQIVTRKALVRNIRTIGSVVTDQTRETNVHTRISGWIESIHVDYVGKAVRKGDPLYDLYSPDLISTQEEYLEALQQGRSGAEGAASAVTRLRFWGVAESELRKLKAARSALHAITFYSPSDGIVIRKAAVFGAYVTPETELYYLADISKIWLLLTLYEADVSLIEVGDRVTVSLSYDAAKRYKGVINYIFPEIDALTRTAKARVEIVNSDQFLRPGMFANVEIKKPLPEMLVVPADAVLDTGQRKIVFVKAGDTELVPREVETGVRVDDLITILSGLQEGDAVVVGASFLIDAESRMQAALRKGKSAAKGHGEHAKQ